MARKKSKDINASLLYELIKSPEFNSLNDDLKKTVFENLENILENETKKGTGIMEKFFGNHSKNIPLYIALIIVISLIIVGIIDIFISPEYKGTTNLEFWQTIGPIISGALGYIFGSGSKK